MSLLVAMAVNAEGYREILGIVEGAKEDRAGWSSFLKHLKERGLQGVRMIISDACIGLAESAAEFYPDAHWQRCTVHFYRNVYSHVPRPKMREVAAMLKAIHAAEDIAAAREKAQATVVSPGVEYFLIVGIENSPGGSLPGRRGARPSPARRAAAADHVRPTDSDGGGADDPAWRPHHDFGPSSSGLVRQRHRPAHGARPQDDPQIHRPRAGASGVQFAFTGPAEQACALPRLSARAGCSLPGLERRASDAGVARARLSGRLYGGETVHCGNPAKAGGEAVRGSLRNTGRPAGSG